MREAESAYWDTVAASVIRSPGVFADNWLKRQILAQFLFKCTWNGQRVLEIGVGCGINAALLRGACGGHWSYIGTDLSPKFAESARRLGLNIVQADVLSLPPGPFTRIIALDSLEHVRPEDRSAGYAAIAERLEQDGLLFINMPLNRSLHEDEFDHGIDLGDIYALAKLGLSLVRYERYDIHYGNYKRDYAFVVMRKEVEQ